MNSTGKPRRRKPRNSRSVWEDPTGNLNKEAPTVKKLFRREKWKRRYLKFNALIAVPLILLMTFAVFTNATAPDTDATDPAAASRAVNGSYGKAAAFSAVSEWLAGAPAPLPGGSIVSWDGYSTQEAPPPEDENDTPIPYRYETHNFTVSADTGAFAVSVLVAVDGAHQVTVIGSPSPRPLVTGEVDEQLVPWFGLEQTSASGPVKDSASAWADAYMSGDAEQLRRTVQDKDPKHYYIPFVGVERVDSVSVTAAAYLPAGDPDAEPKFMTVRVDVKVWWDGTAPPQKEDAEKSSTGDGNGDETAPALFTFDLLVDDPDSASPVVVAWGAPGSGSTLEPFQNATDTPVEVPDRDQPNSKDKSADQNSEEAAGEEEQ